MTVIFETNSINIHKNSDSNYKLNFENGEKFPNFFNFIKKKLNITKNTNKSFTFKAIKVEKLKNLLKRKESFSYRHLKEIYNNIAKQFESLEKDNFCHLFLDINDIIRVEIDKESQIGGSGYDIIFLYLNTSNFLPIKNKFTKIIKPFDKKNIFISPELKSITQIPIDIHINSQLYSLAVLTCYCGEWNKTPSKYNNIDKDISFYKDYLSNIENSKLYWSLLRCLNPNSNERIYLYI